MAKLCVNIDHVATIRQARLEEVPEPWEAARLAEKGGAIGITIHLREDRRHIQDRDLWALKGRLQGKLNLEMAATPEMFRIALKARPESCTLVPEKRLELTTEGGLEVAGRQRVLKKGIASLRKAGIQVSLFVSPELRQLVASRAVGADLVELHTGAYAEAFKKAGAKAARRELRRLEEGAVLAQSLALGVNAGHGLSYDNVAPVAKISGMQELNIGHNIVARSVMVGMQRAVREMILAMKG